MQTKTKIIFRLRDCFNVRSRAIDRLILKIDKNVKSTEFDHNGVCPGGYKYLVLLFQRHSRLFLCQSCQKVVVKELPSDSEKWRHFVVLFYRAEQNAGYENRENRENRDRNRDRDRNRENREN